MKTSMMQMAEHNRRMSTRKRVMSCALLLALCACSAPTDPAAAFFAGRYHTAQRLWTVNAERGNAVAQNYLGLLYFCGLGVPIDHKTAGYWFGRAAVQGNAHAQRNLGLLFEQGRGLPRDTMRAIGWYLRSGRSGNARAFDALKAMGSEVTTNLARQGEAIVNADIVKGQVSTR